MFFGCTPVSKSKRGFVPPLDVSLFSIVEVSMKNLLLKPPPPPLHLNPSYSTGTSRDSHRYCHRLAWEKEEKKKEHSCLIKGFTDEAGDTYALISASSRASSYILQKITFIPFLPKHEKKNLTDLQYSIRNFLYGSLNSTKIASLIWEPRLFSGES